MVRRSRSATAAAVLAAATAVVAMVAVVAGTAMPGGAANAAAKLDVTGSGGTVSTQTVSLYNAGNAPARVTGDYRVAGPEFQLGQVVTEDVSADPANGNIICFALFDPQGRLAQLSYDDGQPAGRRAASVPDIQHAFVTNPKPGKWTAKILWSGTDQDLALPPSVPGTYTGSMSFKVSGQTLITSTVGRMIGQLSTYEINVPSGRTGIDVQFRTADASPDNKYTFYLVDPSGNVVATDTSPKTVDGTSEGSAELTTADPVAETWQVDVGLNLTVNGKEFTQTVDGSLQDP